MHKEKNLEAGLFKEEVSFEVKYAKDLVKNIALRSNLSTQNCITELIDNAKEATNDCGDVEVAMAAPNLPYGCTLMVKDNGCGMSEDDLRNLFFTIGNGDNKKSGIHAKIGGRLAISKLCESENAYAEIITRKKGCVPIRVKWNGIQDPVGEKVYNESIPYGTTILIYGAELKESDAVDYKEYAALRYYEAIDNGLKLFINGQKIKSEDPLYRDFDDADNVSKIINGSTDVIGPKDGKTYKVTYQLRDLSMFYLTDKNEYRHGFIPHSRDVEKDKFGNEVRGLINDSSRMGFYVKVGGIVIVCGGVIAPYIDRVTHAQMNGKRILLEIPEELAEQLNFQMNKSAGFVDFNRQQTLQALRRDMKNNFESLIQEHVNRANAEHEAEVRGYRSEKNIPKSGEKVVFTANNGVKLPKQTFAAITDDSVIFNQDSTLLKPFKSNKKSFSNTANIVESIYTAFLGALEETRKFQPKFNLDTSPRGTSVTSRDQTIERIKESFIERFMSLGSE